MSEAVDRYRTTGTLDEGGRKMNWLRRFGLGVWSSWPEDAYRENRYHQRLLEVESHLARCLDVAPQGPVRILSICAGDGRDVIDVVRSHSRRPDVAATLVELESHSVAAGICLAAQAKVSEVVHFLHNDATKFETYSGLPAADIVLLCGVWGHVPADDRFWLVRGIESLCKPGGAVIWTRGVIDGLARFDEIRSVFERGAWQMSNVTITSDKKWVVATNRYCGASKELPASGRMFHFRRNAGHLAAKTFRSRISPEAFRKGRAETVARSSC